MTNRDNDPLFTHPEVMDDPDFDLFNDDEEGDEE